MTLDTTEYRTFGPPGTGKTTWMAKEAKRAIRRFGPDQVSICSLTNTAVREAIGRDLPIDADNVTTLHARCKRSLGAPAPAESIANEFVADCPDWATEACLPASLRKPILPDGDSVAETVLAAGGGGVTYYEQAMILRQQLIPQEAWNPNVVRWYRVWRDWCRARGVSDFAGWLEDALEYKSLPSQHVVFVDEAQDHTPLQLAVIRGWKTRIRVLIGDDDQNLYEWSGAIPQAFFSPALPTGQERVLEQSYRVPRRVHSAAIAWIERLRDRRAKVYWPRDADGDLLRTGYSLVDAKRGVLPPMQEGTNMFLTSCSYMLPDLISLLKQEGIPFHNPFRKSNSAWNPLARIGPVIEAFSAPDWTGAQVAMWVKALRQRDVFLRGMQDGLLAQAEALEDEPFPLESLREVMLEQQFNRACDRDLGLLREYRKTSLSPNWDYALRAYRVHSDAARPNLIVGTIHSVKGGEADHVVLFPDMSPAGYNDMLGGGADRIRRLFYVGMTRARTSLTLASASRRQSVQWR